MLAELSLKYHLMLGLVAERLESVRTAINTVNARKNRKVSRQKYREMSRNNFGGVKLKPNLHGINIIWALSVIQKDCLMWHFGIG